MYIPNGRRIYQPFILQGPPKCTKIVIFGLKICICAIWQWQHWLKLINPIYSSPVCPGSKSLSQHSNLAASSSQHHAQNGKAVKSDSVPVVIVDEPSARDRFYKTPFRQKKIFEPIFVLKFGMKFHLANSVFKIYLTILNNNFGFNSF
jgi:hypothetical protein